MLEDFDEIDFEETLQRKRIVFKSYWSEFFNTFIFITIASIACTFLLIADADYNNSNDKIIVLSFLPLFAGLLLFSIFKKIKEKRFYVIETNFDKEKAKKHIESLILSWGWKIQRNNKDFLQAETYCFFAQSCDQVNILYDNNLVYLNILSNNRKIRMPIIFSDIIIKKDFEKALKKTV